MTTAQPPDGQEYVVLGDQEGHYYLLPRAIMDAARISDTSVETLQALLADEVSGYVMPTQTGPAPSFTQQGIIIVSGLSALGAAGISYHVPGGGWNRVRNLTDG